MARELDARIAGVSSLAEPLRSRAAKDQAPDGRPAEAGPTERRQSGMAEALGDDVLNTRLEPSEEHFCVRLHATGRAPEEP